jgi:hypothetical protein
LQVVATLGFLRLKYPYKSLTNRSGLPDDPRRTIDFVMSLSVFLAICVLACDFMIYAFFQWTFGEKHRQRKRRYGSPRIARNTSIKIAASRAYLVVSQERRCQQQTEREVA